MNEQKMFDFFAAKGFTAEGIFGMLGNIKDESGGNPRNLQNSYENKLGFTDDSYTEAVDSKAYKNFAHDAAGYGLAQWTYSTRKENLLKFARYQGESIGDFDMQLAFMYQELQGYKALFAILKTTDSIREASDAFMTQYEKPADQSENVKKRRANYGEEICAMLTGVENDSLLQLTEEEARQKVISIAVSWYGRKEADGSHRFIIDLYNSHTPLSRGYKVKYTDAWCATMASAAAIEAGYTDIIPTECGCGQLIAAFQAMNRWVEDDAYIPSPGDYIFYDWDDTTGVGDCTGWPEHVGIVISVYCNTIKVIEGNKNDAVGYREVTVNGRYIRGYGIPDYASKSGTVLEEIGSNDGQNGSKTAKTGSICKEVQWIGEVTASYLNVRRWAGKEYENIKSFPQLEKGNFVGVCDTVKAADGADWYYIQIASRSHGFVHSKHILKWPKQ